MPASGLRLIGMYDSPFVRRVAVSLLMLGIQFEHDDWSVGREFDRIRRFNPLGRVPALVLADGSSLVESAAILDYIDELVGPARALLPTRGAARRTALQWMAVAIGAAEKARDQVYEKAFRPSERRHAAWVARLRAQTDGALALLDQRCGEVRTPYLLGEQLTQADITLSCSMDFVSDALSLQLSQTHANLAARVRSCESLPAFRTTRCVLSPPQGDD